MKKTMKIKKVFGCLAFASVIALGAMMGVKAYSEKEVKSAKADPATFSGNVTLYLNPHEVSTGEKWDKGDERYAFNYFNNSTSTNGWVSMTATSGDYGLIYEGVLPEGTWEGVIFCRMNGSDSTNNWTNRWNQTEDLVLSGGNDYYTVSSGDSNATGTWGKYSAPKSFYFFNKGKIMNTTTPSVYAYNAGGDNGSYPGAAMSLVDGCNYLYSSTISSYTTAVIFNNGYEGYGNKTGDIALGLGNTCVIHSDWSTQFASFEAAQFVDKYMKFNTIDTSSDGSTVDCATNFNAARTAYNALGGEDTEAGNALRLEVLSITDVAARLGKWATANSASLDTVNGTKLSRASLVAINDYSNQLTAIIILAVVGAVLVSAGGYFLLRKRKEY